MSNQLEHQELGESKNDMLVLFKKCAQEANELAKSISKFEQVFTKIQKSISAIKEVEQNLSDNNSIEQLLERTNEIKQIFEFFHTQIPELNILVQKTHEQCMAQQSSLASIIASLEGTINNIGNLPKLVKDTTHIKELLSQIIEFDIEDDVMRIEEAVKDHSNHIQTLRTDIENQISESAKYISTENAAASKSIVNDIKKQFKESENRISASVNDLIGRIDTMIKESTQSIIVELKDEIQKMSNSSITEIDDDDIDTIYNLYLRSGKQLPIVVCKPGWNNGYRFEVESFKVVANGKTFNNRGIVRQSIEYDADKPEYKLYKTDNDSSHVVRDDDEFPFY